MKNKIILTSILLILSVSVICGCNKEKKELSDSNNIGYNYLDEYKDYKVIDITNTPDYLYDLSDPKVLYGLCDYMAIVRIDSIDGVSNILKSTNEYTSTYTYGKATILKMIKGNINDTKINFIRGGGKMIYKEWILSHPKESQEKLLEMAKKGGLDVNKTIVNDIALGNINIENNKIYLVYMYQDDEFYNNNEFIIQGFQYGLREVNISSSTNTINSLNNIQVKDNDTNKWVSLSSLINFDVDK